MLVTNVLRKKVWCTLTLHLALYCLFICFQWCEPITLFLFAAAKAVTASGPAAKDLVHLDYYHLRHRPAHHWAGPCAPWPQREHQAHPRWPHLQVKTPTVFLSLVLFMCALKINCPIKWCRGKGRHCYTWKVPNIWRNMSVDHWNIVWGRTFDQYKINGKTGKKRMKVIAAISEVTERGKPLMSPLLTVFLSVKSAFRVHVIKSLQWDLGGMRKPDAWIRACDQHLLSQAFSLFLIHFPKSLRSARPDGKVKHHPNSKSLWRGAFCDKIDGPFQALLEIT